MKRKELFILAAASFAVSLFAFAGGRWSVRPSVANTSTHPVSAVTSEQKGSRQFQGNEEDFSHVTIENLGEVDFDEAYQLLHGAPAEAWLRWTKHLEALPPSPRKTAGITVFFKTLAQLDAQAAVDLALSMTRRDSRAAAASAIEAVAPASTLSEVARMLATANAEGQSTIDLLSKWSRTDPVSASRFVDTHPELADEYGRGALLGNWAAVDPVAAHAWLDRLDERLRTKEVYADFYGSWLESEPAAAQADLIAHAVDGKLETAICNAASALSRESPEMASPFLLRLPKGALRDAAIDQITAHATGRILADQHETNPAVVTRWLVSLPQELWDAHVGYVISAWSARDAAGVNAWLQQQPASTRDYLSAKFCLAHDWVNPQANFDAGLRISDPRLRDETFRQVFHALDSPKRARELLRNANLPPAENARLEAILSQL